MLINVSDRDECRIAITHAGRLEELFMERTSAQSHVGNIYKGRVTNVESSIQAAFVDFGMGKNGFLHISDIQPQYFGGKKAAPEDVGKKTPRKDRPPIQKCLRRGQELIVQIIKEGIGTKGPTLTTYLSIPGRYLVMMPGMNRLGVSRKIEDDDERRGMREVLNQLNLPKGMGFILRTAGLGRNKRELQQDLNYLMRLWKTVAEKVRSEQTPATLYQESDLVTRTIRDVYSADIGAIVVDDEETAKRVGEFLSIAMPRTKSPVTLYSDKEPLFHKYGIESEIQKIHSRHVPLPSGGSLVIDTTEALVAIDVNSGRFRAPSSAEETALRIDLEAAKEIARQLRLRDLGGVIICDFIDLRLDRNKRAVEQTLREALKTHKAKARILRMSQFGIIEITRQRQRPSIKHSVHEECPNCRGSGLVKSAESMTLDVMRMIHLAVHRDGVQKIQVSVTPRVSEHLLNRRRSTLHNLEAATDKHIFIRADESLGLDEVQFECRDARDIVVEVDFGDER